MKVLLLTSVVFLFFGVDTLETINQSKFHTSCRNNVYFIEKDPEYDWGESLVNCDRMNMTLLTIESEEKLNEVNALAEDIVGKSIPLWVGGYRLSSSNEFHWISNGEKFYFTFWATRQPDFIGNAEHCAEMNFGQQMGWNDNVCSAKRGYMCEQRRHLCRPSSSDIINSYGNPKYNNEGSNNYGNPKYHNVQFNF